MNLFENGSWSIKLKYGHLEVAVDCKFTNYYNAFNWAINSSRTGKPKNQMLPLRHKYILELLTSANYFSISGEELVCAFFVVEVFKANCGHSILYLS